MLRVVGTILLVAMMWAQSWGTAGATEILLWSWRSRLANVEFIESVVKPQLSERYGINLTVETMTQAEYREKIVIASASGVAPDITMAGGQEAGVFAHRGLTIPLDRYLESWEGYRDIPPPAWESVHYRGQHYGVPLWMSPRGLGINTRLFEEAGLDSDTPPQLWEEFLEALPKLNRQDGDRLIQSALDLRLSASSAFEDFYRILQQNGGRLYNSDWTEPLFHTDRGQEALNFLLDVYRAARPAHLGASGTYSLQNGRAAMDWGFNDGRMGSLANAVPELARDIEVHFNLRHEHQVTSVYFNSIGINRQSDSPDEAWQVIQYLMSPDVLVEYTRTIDSLPPRMSLVNEVFDNHIPKASRFMQQLPYAHFIEAHPNYFDIRASVGEQFASALREEISVVEAMNQAASIVRPFLVLDE